MKKKLTGKALKRKPQSQPPGDKSKVAKISGSVPTKSPVGVSIQSSHNEDGEGTSSQNRQPKKSRQEKQHHPGVVKTTSKDEEGKKEETKREDYKNDVWNDRYILVPRLVYTYTRIMTPQGPKIFVEDLRTKNFLKKQSDTETENDFETESKI